MEIQALRYNCIFTGSAFFTLHCSRGICKSSNKVSDSVVFKLQASSQVRVRFCILHWWKTWAGRSHHPPPSRDSDIPRLFDRVHHVRPIATHPPHVEHSAMEYYPDVPFRSHYSIQRVNCYPSSSLATEHSALHEVPLGSRQARMSRDGKAHPPSLFISSPCSPTGPFPAAPGKRYAQSYVIPSLSTTPPTIGPSGTERPHVIAMHLRIRK